MSATAGGCRSTQTVQVLAESGLVTGPVCRRTSPALALAVSDSEFLNSRDKNDKNGQARLLGNVPSASLYKVVGVLS